MKVVIRSVKKYFTLIYKILAENTSTTSKNYNLHYDHNNVLNYNVNKNPSDICGEITISWQWPIFSTFFTVHAEIKEDVLPII